MAEYVATQVLTSSRGSVMYDQDMDHLTCHLYIDQRDIDACPDLAGVDQVWVVIDLNDEAFNE